MSVSQYFDGLVKSKRPSQIEMAEDVEKIINEQGIAFIEAGTGTGKSFAYLVPAIMSGKRIVISTAKKALQTQLVIKDIPYLLSKLPLPKKVLYTQLKGKNNYGCLLNATNYAESSPRAKPFLEWLKESKDADIGTYEYPISFIDEIKVTECSWKNCPHMSKCGYLKNKTLAKDADILVVNHSLLAYDLVSPILGEYDVLIIDEAHQAPEFFRNALSFKLGSDFYEMNCKLKVVDIPSIFESIIHGIFTIINGKEGKIRHDKLHASFKTLKQECETFIEYLRSGNNFSEFEFEAKDPRLGLISKNFYDLLKQCKVILGETEGKWVSYFENEELTTAPLSIGGLIGPILKNKHSVIFTSATLATNKSFNFISRDLGLKDEDIKIKKILPSPFDYKNRTRLYVTTEGPDPSQLKGEAYHDKTIALIQRLIVESNGGAFILCTSKTDMYAFYERLRLAATHEILMQGTKLEPQVEKFKKNPKAVLIGVKSLWEGVDVPGLGLRLVIIPKLPFPTPSDVILTEKKVEFQDYLEEAGHENPSLKAWETFDLQQAIIDLKQGVGRLMRSETDAGVIAILDPRIITKRYGNKMISELNIPISKEFNKVKLLLEVLRGKIS